MKKNKIISNLDHRHTRSRSKIRLQDVAEFLLYLNTSANHGGFSTASGSTGLLAINKGETGSEAAYMTGSGQFEK